MILGATTEAPAARDKKGGPSMLPGGNSHEPISIDAGKLDYYDKEQKLVYSGNFVAVQGDSTLKGSQLTIYLTKDDQKAAAAQPAGETAAAAATAGAASAPSGQPAPAAQPGAGSSVKHMDVKGPVMVISKDQIGTGDNASYDKGENKVTLIGNVTLSQGTNITKGDRLVYDLTSGQAQVFSGQTYTRVRSVFTPGSSGPGDALTPAKKKDAPKAKPAGTASTQ